MYRSVFIGVLAALASFGGLDASAQAPGVAGFPLPAGQTNDPFPQPASHNRRAINRFSPRFFGFSVDVSRP